MDVSGNSRLDGATGIWPKLLAVCVLVCAHRRSWRAWQGEAASGKEKKGALPVTFHFLVEILSVWRRAGQTNDRQSLRSGWFELSGGGDIKV
jgi:hypothetical protein